MGGILPRPTRPHALKCVLGSIRRADYSFPIQYRPTFEDRGPRNRCIAIDWYTNTSFLSLSQMANRASYTRYDLGCGLGDKPWIGDPTTSLDIKRQVRRSFHTTDMDISVANARLRCPIRPDVDVWRASLSFLWPEALTKPWQYY